LKKIGVVIFVVAIVLIGGVYSGILPLSILSVNTETENKNRSGLYGIGELIGPNNRKGFITSYMDDGLSETITCTGVVGAETFGRGMASKYKYVVYGMKNGAWETEPLSKPGKTSEYVSYPNPGEKSLSGLKIGGTFNANSYDFEIMGHDYDAIRVDFYLYMDGDVLNPLDEWKWWLVQRDEAYLYEGWGGLYLPTDSDGRPRSTFEIGETVNINVETSYGGQAIGEGKTWRVALIEPEDQGGSEVKHEDYGDNVKSTFSFKVTESMFSKSSTNRYRIQIYNTLLPKGTLNVNTIDLLASAPSDVSFGNAPTQSKVGNGVSIDLSADVNSDTQLNIDYFEVSVIYGHNNVLLPSDPTSNIWLINTFDYDASNNRATVSFTPEKESYVTVHAKAYDTEGRASLHTKTWTLWAYADIPVPDDTIDDETGEEDYGGGKSPENQIWDPSGFWENTTFGQTILIWIICILIFVLFAVVGWIFFKASIWTILIVVLGAVVAGIIYYLWTLGFFL